MTKKRYVSKKLRRSRRKKNGWNMLALMFVLLIMYSVIGTTFLGVYVFVQRMEKDIDSVLLTGLPVKFETSICELEPKWEETVLPANPEPRYQCSETEKVMLMKVLSAEGYGYWSYSDYLSLMTVVLNRYDSPEFPDNFYDILVQPLQFEVVGNGRYLEAEITDECRQAVEDGLAGKRNLNTEVKWFCTQEYYNSMAPDDFFHTLKKVYLCRNVYFFQV